MDPNESRSILESYSVEKRRTLQELVDRAVRSARVSGYCEQFENVMRTVLPEFVITGQDRYGSGLHRAFDTDGLTCRGETIDAVTRGGRNRATLIYGPDGYCADDDRDRDGFNRVGYDVSGYDAEGFTSSSNRDGFYRTGYSTNSVYREWETDGLEQPDDAQRMSGWDRRGRYVHLDADGTWRMGRAATETDTAPVVQYNPTTWAPEGESPIRGTSDGLQAYALESDDDDGDYDDSDDD
jgi:hypothetical protein